jgi:hypothetical protein
MLEFKDLVKGVEYRVVNNKYDTVYKIAESGNLLVKYGDNSYILSNANYNELINLSFVEREWMPKNEELYFHPSYVECSLYDCSYWYGLEDDLAIQRNIGIYRTKEEAIAKAKELGWT